MSQNVALCLFLLTIQIIVILYYNIVKFLVSYNICAPTLQSVVQIAPSQSVVQTPTSQSVVQTATSLAIVQMPTSCTCQQDADREAANVMWMIMAVLFLVVAILLAITSIALGTMLCLTRKPVKSIPPSNLTLHQG